MGRRNRTESEETQLGSINMDRVREFAELKVRKDELEEEKSTINTRLAELAPKILDEFEKESTSQVRTAFGLVHLSRTGWARVVKSDPTAKRASRGDRRRAIEALQAAGLGDFVTENFNTQTVSGYFRDLKKEGRDLPPELEGALVFDESFELRVRRS